MITSIQGNSLSMAGLLANVSTLRVLRSHGNLSKPVTFRATAGGAQNAGWNVSTSMNAGKRSGSGPIWKIACLAPAPTGGCGAHHTTRFKLPYRDKKGLRSEGIPVYGYSAPLKSGAGIGVLEKYKATHDAPSVFFVSSHSLTLFSALRL